MFLFTPDLVAKFTDWYTQGSTMGRYIKAAQSEITDLSPELIEVEGVKGVDLSWNPLRVLTNIPQTTENLFCTHAKLTYVQLDLNQLESLDLSQNPTPTIILRTPNLDTLNLSRCKLTTLPTFEQPPTKLIRLNLSGNLFSELDLTDYPIANLKLNGNRQLIPEKIKLPSTVKSLDLSDCGLTRLPNLPTDLRELKIVGNSITSLQGLNSKIQSVRASGNPIHRLGSLPPTLRHIWLSSTPLETVIHGREDLTLILNDTRPKLVELNPQILRYTDDFSPDSIYTPFQLARYNLPTRLLYHSAASLIQRIWRGNAVRNRLSDHYRIVM